MLFYLVLFISNFSSMISIKSMMIMTALILIALVKKEREKKKKTEGKGKSVEIMRFTK